MQNANFPFIDRVMRFPPLERFKVPHINRYDGDGNPTNHMENFQAHLVLHDTLDEIVCRAFPLTLKGSHVVFLCIKYINNKNNYSQ